MAYLVGIRVRVEDYSDRGRTLEFVVNLKTAKDLGIDMPTSILFDELAIAHHRQCYDRALDAAIDQRAMDADIVLH